MNNMEIPTNIDLSTLEDVDCENCESSGFVPVYTLKKLPAILSPDGAEHVVPVFQRFECIDCGFAIIN